MQQYCLDFSDYCKRIPCVEFYESNSTNPEVLKRTKIKFKLDYDKDLLRLEDIKRIQHQIARILKIKPSMLYLHCIEDGCTTITFLILTLIVTQLLKVVKDEKAALTKEVKMISVECDSEHHQLVCVVRLSHYCII